MADLIDVALLVTRLVHEDGRTSLSVKQDGHATADVLLGMLELAKLVVISEGRES